MSDQDRISPDKNQYSIKQTKDENKKKSITGLPFGLTGNSEN